MKKYILTLLIFLTIIPFIKAQEESEEALKETYLDGEFFFYEEEYVDAITFYQRLLKRGYADNANINYKIGICYLNIPGQKDQSVSYLEKASEKATESYKESVFKQDKAPLDVFLYLGNAYRVNNMLDKAIKTYNKYITVADEKKVLEIKYARQQIQCCRNAKEMQANPVKVEYTNLGSGVNTSRSNYYPVISGDGNTMVYMNELPFYHAINYMTKAGNGWSVPRNLTPEIQSDGDLYCHGLSFDGKTLLMSKVDPFNSDIWVSYLQDDGKWSVAIPLRKTVNTKFFESHATFSPDGNRIYFASNNNLGIGAMDIYVTEKDAEGEWKEPENLGKVINTEFNEDSPVLTPDGKKLFFSSQGHYNIGGYDIFYSELKDGEWGEPVNLGYPINTTDDDLFFYPVGDGSAGYLSRLAEDSYGKDDIYYAVISEYIPEEPLITEEPEPEVIAEAAMEQPVEETEIAEEPAEVIPQPTEAIPPPEEPVTAELQKPVPVTIEPVYFDFNSTSLRNDAIKTLDIIIELLKKDIESKVVLTGYTDSKGTEEINKIISLRRAEAAREYLVRNEIGYKRIEIIGKGETEFVARNSNPDGSDNPMGRKYNRRVEIKLINLNQGTEVIMKINVPEDLKPIQ